MFGETHIVTNGSGTNKPGRIEGTSSADRRKLLAAGFEPLPILAAEKKPYIKGWTQGEITDARLSDWEDAHPDHKSTGIRTGRVVAIDVDLTDPDHAAAVEMTIESELGATPFKRVGSKGAIYLYRMEGEPLAKITLKGTPPNDTHAQKIEILGQGQQFVAYGLHPSTGAPYQWTESDPLGSSLADLPAVSPGRLREAAKLARLTLEGLGYSDLTDPETLTGERKSRKDSAGTGQPVSLENMRAWLSHVDPTDRDTWRDMSFAVSSANIVEGAEPITWEQRAELYDAWSRGDLNPEHQPHNYMGRADCDVMLEYGDPDKPNGITVATLIHRATLAGWEGSPYESLLDAFERADGYQACEDDYSTGPESVEESKSDRFNKILSDLLAKTKSAQQLPAEDELDAVEIVLRGSTIWAKGFVSLETGPGNAGKSTINMLRSLALATGDASLTGEEMPEGKQRVLSINCEDGQGLIENRFVAMLKALQVEKPETVSYLSGLELVEPLKLARDVGGVAVIDFAAERAIVELLRRGNFDVVIFDPLVKLSDISENDNHKLDALMECLSRIAVKANVAVVVIAHVGQAAAEKRSANPFAIRGGTAAPWAARSVGVYYQATVEEVANLKESAAGSLEGVKGDLRAGRFVYSQPTAKNNIGLPLEGKRFYYMESVKLANGYEVGVPIRLEERKAAFNPYRAMVELAAKVESESDGTSERAEVPFGQAVTAWAAEYGVARQTVEKSIKSKFFTSKPVPLSNGVKVRVVERAKGKQKLFALEFDWSEMKVDLD